MPIPGEVMAVCRGLAIADIEAEMRLVRVPTSYFEYIAA